MRGLCPDQQRPCIPGGGVCPCSSRHKWVPYRPQLPMMSESQLCSQEASCGGLGHL